MNPEESLNKIKIVGVIGAGGMGNQIAELMARIGGYKVNIVDINIEFVNKGLAAIDNRLEKFFVAKGKMSAEEKKNLINAGSTPSSVIIVKIPSAFTTCPWNICSGERWRTA